ncbi:MAG TPA: hypothetical protein VFM84_02590 [Holophagaceae bacterium]|nr:hypothetical protein [Holophagaceae bacterium]
MNLDRLTRLEDLTRRYAKCRPGGAGLGMLWGGLVYQFSAGLTLGWVLRQVTDKDTMHTLIHSQMKTPVMLMAAGIATPIVVWLGVCLLQGWVDKRFGAVVGQPASRVQYPRWLLPGFVIGCEGMLLVFSFLNAFVVNRNDPAHALDPWKVGGALAIALLAVLWGRAEQDQQTRGLMMAVSIPSIFILMSGPVNLLEISVISGAYLALMLGLMIKGALRFAEFLKVSRELDALQPEGE